MYKVFYKLKPMSLSSVRIHAVGIGLGILAVLVIVAIGVPQSSIVQSSSNEQLPWRTKAPNTVLHTVSGEGKSYF